ncbi:MAG: signal peptidase I [Coriobacteriia bacterium]|nr:signal peptidase I [Coriobacteriia bacterium]
MTDDLNPQPYRPAGDSDADIPSTPEHDHKQGGMLRWVLETVLMVALAFALAQGIKAFVLQPYVIPTGSMEPTIMTGDRVLAEKLSFRWRAPQQGDIVVFDDPADRYPQLIKRVIAVAGQTVDIVDGKVYVDGSVLAEPYVHDVDTTPGTVAVPLVVPEGHVWLMGDNRPNSGDSRFLGPQPVGAVHGRAFAIYWPLSHIGSFSNAP